MEAKRGRGRPKGSKKKETVTPDDKKKTTVMGDPEVRFG